MKKIHCNFAEIANSDVVVIGKTIHFDENGNAKVDDNRYNYLLELPGYIDGDSGKNKFTEIFDFDSAGKDPTKAQTHPRKEKADKHNSIKPIDITPQEEKRDDSLSVNEKSFDITSVKGIAEVTKGELAEAGFITFMDFFNAKPKDLQKIVPERVALKIVNYVTEFKIQELDM